MIVSFWQSSGCICPMLKEFVKSMMLEYKQRLTLEIKLYCKGSE